MDNEKSFEIVAIRSRRNLEEMYFINVLSCDNLVLVLVGWRLGRCM